MTKTGESAEVLFDKALDVADRHLESAMKESGPLADYVVVAMIEAAVNRAVEVAGHDDIVDMLRDLAQQIEDDGAEAGDEEDEEEDEDEED